ncbi:MAG: bifunctional ornithine acetyltransferase/N-acetylglutamate synthase [Actinobacteria bacterium]|nr:bifunctional ornithine acetyltransferase/N-acetylglutamate synthase [Actinomycetota bacterium]
MIATASRFVALPDCALPADGSVTFPMGFRAAGVHAGLKRSRRDVGLLVSDAPGVSAAFFTRNRAAAAPVSLTRDECESGALRAVVANSAVANACTGPQGERDARRMRELAARLLELPATQVAVSSTGVIGEPLPMPIVEKGIERAAEKLSPEGGEHFAAAIRTTDRIDKQGALSVAVRCARCASASQPKGPA